MATTSNRRPATHDDLPIGALCFKGNGATRYVVIARSAEDAVWPFYSVAKFGSKAAERATATGQRQGGGTLNPLSLFTVEG